MEFDDFHKWVYREFKINLNAYKQDQLNRRITSLMNRVGVKSLEEYQKLIMRDKEQKDKFLDFITINVTEFFRNPDLFSELEKVIKREFIGKNKNLKIWSAACSTGCEPYSIAIMLKELDGANNHKIIATDIDRFILQKAKKGIYDKSDVRNIDKALLNKYFTESGENFILSQSIKNMIEFKRHDLILDKYDTDFDLIVCRNVVIYFKNDIKNQIFMNFNKSLKKGGLLFVGATESIYNYKDYGFEKISTFIYRKV